MARKQEKQDKNKNETVVFNCRLQTDLHNRLIHLSHTAGITVAFVIRRALSEWLDQNEERYIELLGKDK